MKKRSILAILLATVMIISLAACGGNDEPSKTEAPNKSEENVEPIVGGDVNDDGKIVVGYISKNIVDPFHAPINDHATKVLNELVDDGTIDSWTGVLDGETDAGKQIDRADECIAKKSDYVIILPAEATASDPAVTKMTEAGIKVIVVNSKTDSTDDVALAYVGPDDVKAGELMAEWVIKNLPEGGKYAHLQGVIGNSAQIQRGQGIENIMSDNPQFESIGDFPCDWQADLAANVASDQLNKYGDELVAIIADNDDMSSSAQKTVNDAGRSDIVCVGVDGNPNPLQMVKDGEMGATVLQDGEAQVQGAIDLILKALKGEEVEDEVLIPFVLVTADNVDEYLE